MAKYSKAQREESLAALREVFKPGDTVYCILRSVSRSGMSRVISFVTVRGDDTRIWDYAIARVLGETLAAREGLKITGCGMDMGFATVYNLSRALFPDGFGIEGTSANGGTKHRPKNRKHAALLVSKGWKFRGRNGNTSGWDTDGGYALNHQWL